jgi:Zn-dependent protease with chaperone function
VTQRGLLFDGTVALQSGVDVTLVGGTLELDHGGWVDQVEIADLQRIESEAGTLRFAHRDRDGWRLALAPPFDEAFVARLPRRARLTGTSGYHRMVIALGGLVGLATAALIAVVAFPDQLAPHIPLALEKRVGAAMVAPFGQRVCNDPAGQAALDALVDRLDPAARRDGIDVRILDIDMVNAVALPGQRVMLFAGLLDQVDDADAVAGVLAHELAHVRRRHVAGAMVRELGLGLMATVSGGGVIAGNAQQLVSLRFSRAAEAEADAEAIAMLARAGISPRPTGKAFAAFADGEGGAPEWLESHPASRGRAKRFAAAYVPGTAYRPALTSEEAGALSNACRTRPTLRKAAEAAKRN